jgi:transcriptional regulator with XRE-family HTH domain
MILIVCRSLVFFLTVLGIMKNGLLESFGERIRELRKSKDWSQEVLAEKTGFHRTYIGMIERGERNPSLININVFAESFDMSISDLLKLT